MSKYPQILATGSYVPERVVSNAEVDALLGESTDQWLIDNVGIRERRWMAPDQVTSDLVVEASKKALGRAGISPSDLDLIIVSTDTPDYLSPSPSAVVQAKPGADLTEAEMRAYFEPQLPKYAWPRLVLFGEPLV